MANGFGNVRAVAALFPLAIVATSTAAGSRQQRGVVREWPCRRVVERPLLQLDVETISRTSSNTFSSVPRDWIWRWKRVDGVRCVAHA